MTVTIFTNTILTLTILTSTIIITVLTIAILTTAISISLSEKPTSSKSKATLGLLVHTDVWQMLRWLTFWCLRFRA